MARPSSPTSSEGFGFTYADKVGAVALLALLRRVPFAEAELGVTTKVQFGQRPAGWHFDDLLITSDHHGEERRLACSIKSNNHLSGTGIAQDIVELAWLQVTDGDPFNESLDRLALIQPSPSGAIRHEIAELYRWATRQDSGQLEDWLQPHVAANLKRAYVDSVRLGVKQKDPQQFFRCFRAIFFDLDPPFDQLVREAQPLCMGLLSNATEAQGESLWVHLCQIAADMRGSAGALTLSGLLSRLTPHFIFREHPRVEQDLIKLRQFSTNRHISSVRDVIGVDLKLPGTEGIQQVTVALGKAPIVVFLGPSGSGKSVVLKQFVEQAPEGELRLYFRADLSSMSPSTLQRDLGLQHSLADCLSEGRFGHVTLVIDQVDRLLTETHLADLSELLVATKHLQPGLRIVLGCQTAEAERILSRLAQVLDLSALERTIFAPDEEAMFESVIQRFPALRNIAFRKELRPIFLRAKNLDLLVGRLDQLGQLSGQQVTSQKHFIDWFWDNYVLEGANGLARSTLMRELADIQANLLSPYVDPRLITDRQTLDLLRTSDLLTGDDRGVTFQHDLYGDWARFRTIETESDNLTQFLLDRGTNPLWLRAIRLWSAILLETEGAVRWRERFESFSETDGSGWMVRDALLDGLALAAGSYQYLTELREIFFENNGKLLKRFLSRFLFATTWPDDQLAQAFANGNPRLLATYRSSFRVPQWYLWWPVIRFIIANRESGKIASELVTEVLASWLENSPKGMDTAEEASRLALSIAEEFVKIPSYSIRNDDSYSTRICRCTFLALKHIPNEAEDFIKIMLGIEGEDQFQDAEVISGERYVRCGSLFGPEKVRLAGPWPDGPVANPNDRFRQFVLMGGGFREAHAYSPLFAEQMILAAAIDSPHPMEPDHGLSGFMQERCMCLTDDRTFYPPLYDNNLFHVMYAADPILATKIVLQLVNFATDRWHEMLLDREVDDSIEITIGGHAKVLTGGAAAYSWHRDGMNCSDIVVCALMSLEHFIYEQIDAGSGEKWIENLISNIQSTAILGLLVTIGRKFPELFASTLRFLHFNEVVQWWDTHHVVGGERHQMISWQGHTQTEIKRAEEWHKMPHRVHHLKGFAFYVLNDPEGRKEALKVSKKWKKRAKHVESDHRAALENLAAVYDVKNYSFEQVENGVLINCNLPKKLQKAATEHLATSQRKLNPMLLAHRCRELLTGDANLSEEELLSLYKEATETNQEDVMPGSLICAQDVWCGVASVFLLQYEDWLKCNPEIHTWCLEALLNTCNNPPPASEYEVSNSISEDQWCHFAAQAIPKIWGERPTDSKVREGIANLIEDFRYKTVAYLAHSLFTLRAMDLNLYDQAVQLHRAWAVHYMRIHEENRRSSMLVEDSRLLPPLEPESYSQIRLAFINGTLTTTLIPLPEPDIPTSVGGRGRKKRRSYPKVDTVRLSYFVTNLPMPDTLTGADQIEVIERWSELFDELILEIEGNQDDDGNSVSWSSEEWHMFEKFGYLAASLSDSRVAERFLNSIKQIIKFAEHHAERFFDGLFDRLLRGEEPDEIAESNWKLAVEVFLGTSNPSAESWQGRDYGPHEWEDWIIGNTPLLRKYCWKETHRVFVARHSNVFESWIRAALRRSRSFMSCLRFFTLPSAEFIRADVCLWLKDMIGQGIIENHPEKVSDELATFLVAARTEVTACRKVRKDVFEAYLDLLVVLNRGNNRLAMQLLEDVTTLR